jgi:hypothetical protein
MATVGLSPVLLAQESYALKTLDFSGGSQAEIVEDNVYVVWSSNESRNWEVFFRASTDGGQTFGDKINLSNTSEADSTDVHMNADASNVVVTWWERNQTSNVPVIRVSTDNGKTFGPVLKLTVNGTIGSAAG